MKYGCNVRSRNAKLQVRKNGILARHRTALRSSGWAAQAVVSNEISKRITLTVITPRLRLRRASDESGELSWAYVAPLHPQLKPILSRRASVVKGRQPRLPLGDRNRQAALEEDCRSALQRA
jgi:hypothetical protein